MDKKPSGSFWNLVLTTFYIASSLIFYEKVKPTVGKVSVRVVATIFRILGFKGFADMLKSAENPSYDYDNEEFNDEESTDEEFNDDSLFLD
jgi:hypothetical protein